MLRFCFAVFVIGCSSSTTNDAGLFGGTGGMSGSAGVAGQLPSGGAAGSSSGGTSGSACGILAPGTSLVSGQSLRSCNEQFVLTLQSDGNLIFYDRGNVLWLMGFPGSDRATMNEDGDFSLYVADSKVGSTQTSGHAGAHLIVGDDAKIRVMDQSVSIWSAPGSLTCEGNVAAGWSGCNYTGCGVCTQTVTSYSRYFSNHPGCWANSDTACEAANFLPCSDACPKPTAIDL